MVPSGGLCACMYRTLRLKPCFQSRGRLSRTILIPPSCSHIIGSFIFLDQKAHRALRNILDSRSIIRVLIRDREIARSACVRRHIRPDAIASGLTELYAAFRGWADVYFIYTCYCNKMNRKPSDIFKICIYLTQRKNVQNDQRLTMKQLAKFSLHTLTTCLYVCLLLATTLNLWKRRKTLSLFPHKRLR